MTRRRTTKRRLWPSRETIAQARAAAPPPRANGRPGLGAAARSRRVQIMVTPAVDAAVTAAAREAGQSRSDWGEVLIRRALGELTATDSAGASGAPAAACTLTTQSWTQTQPPDQETDDV